MDRPTHQHFHPWRHAKKHCNWQVTVTGWSENSCIQQLFTDTVVYAQMIIHSASPESITRLPRQQRLYAVHDHPWSMANKAGGEGINCSVEDAMTADWQWHMTLVLTPAAWTGTMLNHWDLWRWCSWEEMAVKQQHKPLLGFSPWHFDLMSNGYIWCTGQTTAKTQQRITQRITQFYSDVRGFCPECLSCK